MKKSVFTLIELLVSAACKVRVLPFYYLKIIYKNDTSLRPQGRTSRIFDNGQKCSSHLHIFTQSAFTLIELLVVIAIIAILAAMLMPALQKARERGKTSFCQSNMKNIGTASTIYSQMHDDWIVPGTMPPFGYNNSPDRKGVWYRILGGVGGGTNYGITGKWHQWSTHIYMSGMLHCPSGIDDLLNGGTPIRWNYVDYVINYGLSGHYVNNNLVSGAMRKTNVAKYPSKVIFATERMPYGEYIGINRVVEVGYKHGTSDPRREKTPSVTNGSPEPYYYLTGTANFVYLDGHVSNKGIRDLPSVKNMYAAFTSADILECGFDRNNYVILKP